MDIMAVVGFLGGLASELTLMTYLIAGAVAIWFVFTAFKDVIAKGEASRMAMQSSSDASWGYIAAKLAVASLLITFATTLDMFAGLNDGSQVRSALAYVQGTTGGNAVTNAVWASIRLWCLAVGTIGFLRGWILFVSATKGGHDGGDKFWQGLWHVVGGALLVNIFS